jgi:glyoxylase I family protein
MHRVGPRGFCVSTLEELQAWVAWLDELGIEHSGIRTGDEPYGFATVVFRDPDNIQLELFMVC